MQKETKSMQNNKLTIKITVYRDNEVIAEPTASSFEEAEEVLGSLERDYERKKAQYEMAAEDEAKQQNDPENKGVESLSEWAEMHGAEQDKRTGEWTV